MGYEAGERTGNTSPSSAVCVVVARMELQAVDPLVSGDEVSRGRLGLQRRRWLDIFVSPWPRTPDRSVCQGFIYFLVASEQVETGREVLWSIYIFAASSRRKFGFELW